MNSIWKCNLSAVVDRYIRTKLQMFLNQVTCRGRGAGVVDQVSERRFQAFIRKCCELLFLWNPFVNCLRPMNCCILASYVREKDVATVQRLPTIS